MGWAGEGGWRDATSAFQGGHSGGGQKAEMRPLARQKGGMEAGLQRGGGMG